MWLSKHLHDFLSVQACGVWVNEEGCNEGLLFLTFQQKVQQKVDYIKEGQLRECTVCGLLLMLHAVTSVPFLSQAVYADAYVATSANLGVATRAIIINELNLYNLQISLAGQRLLFDSTTAGKTAQRTL